MTCLFFIGVLVVDDVLGLPVVDDVLGLPVVRLLTGTWRYGKPLASAAVHCKPSKGIEGKGGGHVIVHTGDGWEQRSAQNHFKQRTSFLHALSNATDLR